MFLLIFFSASIFTGKSQNITVHAESAVKYLLSCQKPNGAFGPTDKEYTDVAWTYPAVHALKLLGEEIQHPDSCWKNGGKSVMEIEALKNGPWYWSLHQKVNLHKLLKIDGPLEETFPKDISLQLHFKNRKTYLEPRHYDDGEFFNMASLWNVVEAIYLMNGKVENAEEIKDYIVKRQAENGGFDDMLGDINQPDKTKTHIIVTHDAVMTLTTLGFDIPNKKQLINWLQSCQTTDGGFCWSPDNNSFSNQADVWYTFAAIRLLNLLGEKPKDTGACLNWLNSLQNSDGGFGDQPGWNSRIYSTYYAVHAIQIITGDVKNSIEKKTIPVSKKEIPEGVYSIFQAQHKTPSGGSEMVDSIAAMKFNFVAIKTTEKEVLTGNGTSEVVTKARQYAKLQGYKLEIVDCPENYAHRLVWFSGMNGDHCSNMLIPTDLTKKQSRIYRALYNEGLKRYNWEEFKAKVIKPAKELGTLFYPELDFTMMNAYMVYDDGLDGNLGYNAVPAAHFNNIDWVRHFPYKERWVGQLPMIADGDAHGNFVKWKANLEMFRNVFLAKDYRLKDYIDASLNGRSVCVIKMPDSDEVRYYGASETVEYLKKHLNEWKWW